MVPYVDSYMTLSPVLRVQDRLVIPLAVVSLPLGIQTLSANVTCGMNVMNFFVFGSATDNGRTGVIFRVLGVKCKISTVLWYFE